MLEKIKSFNKKKKHNNKSSGSAIKVIERES